MAKLPRPKGVPEDAMAPPVPPELGPPPAMLPPLENQDPESLTPPPPDFFSGGNGTVEV